MWDWIQLAVTETSDPLFSDFPRIFSILRTPYFRATFLLCILPTMLIFPLVLFFNITYFTDPVFTTLSKLLSVSLICWLLNFETIIFIVDESTSFPLSMRLYLSDSIFSLDLLPPSLQISSIEGFSFPLILFPLYESDLIWKVFLLWLKLILESNWFSFLNIGVEAYFS